MKVKGTGSTSATSSAKKAKKTSSAGGADFAAQLADCMGVEDSSPVSSTDSLNAVGGVDAIFAAQDVGSSTEEQRKRMVQRADDILDRLEELRDSLLIGRISKERLIELAQMVRARREQGGDPRLTAILDEIELRAEVELAKLSR